MAKNDHERSERRIDEQMKQGQGYLTGVQQQLGNQYSGISNYYSGGGFPQVGNTYGYGSTVPHYSYYGQPMFSGNGTDTPMYSVGSGQSSGARANSGGNPEQAVMSILSRYAPSSEGLQMAMPEIQKMFPGTRFDRSGGPVDEIVIPGYGLFDVLRNAETGGNKSWQFSGGNGGGFGGGGYGGATGFFNPGGAAGMAFQDYGNLQNAYGNLFGNLQGRYGGLMDRWSGFADTGGYSEADKANIRSRAISPIRSIYSNARQGLDRQRALQGGYSPGYATALGRFSREQGQLTSDATTNAEAAIAEMVQKGKLAGLGGMTGTLGNMGSTLGGLLGGQASLYGATPGLANMFGNQTLQAMAQQLQAAGLQNQLSLGLIGAQNQMSQIPGNFDSFMNSIGGVGRAAGQVGGAIYPWL